MKDQDALDLGFTMIKEYPHNQFFTRRYEKNGIFLEFTFENNELIHIDITLEEICGTPISKTELKALDEAFTPIYLRSIE